MTVRDCAIFCRLPSQVRCAVMAFFNRDAEHYSKELLSDLEKLLQLAG